MNFYIVIYLCVEIIILSVAENEQATQMEFTTKSQIKTVAALHKKK